ncbi:TRAP transporter substrate-binding protein DctP [Sulfuriflexus sp.]|uniref:TRAP transporter substrate-binding protein n=1 Tax=Sulfuriflexus sp. TaxID=2015443 RepID=UPI0028CC0649|nr:TRAP transporter substrate-binding protein DctP [Sulfuriflexus sp.]MDT8405467.1 TRAP transporter substrate-binding protein DctP [Sulfuriflexus sp.]
MQRLLFFLFLAGMSVAVHAQTFKIATIFPDGTSWMNTVREGANEIEQRTNGRVTFRFYPGGVMGNDATVLRKIRIGQLHGGALTGGGVADIYTGAYIYNLLFAFRSFEEVDYVRQRMDSQIIAGLKQNGFISFGLSGGGFAYLMSDNPVASIEDLKKQKVWTPQGDRISRAAFEAIGVSPIPLPLTDVLTGLQTGLINTVGTSPIGAIALQWHTRVKYLTDIPLAYLYATLVVKRETFEKLTAADQKIVHEVMGKIFKKFGEQNREENHAAREALENQGIRFITPDLDKQKEWNDKVSRAMDELAREGLFSEAMLKTLRSHLHDYRQGTRKAK